MREIIEHAPASSLWFFILALTGVAGQVIYSWMLDNWVYFVLNACLVITNTLGLGFAIHRGGMTDSHPLADATIAGVAHEKALCPSEAR